MLAWSCKVPFCVSKLIDKEVPWALRSDAKSSWPSMSVWNAMSLNVPSHQTLDLHEWRKYPKSYRKCHQIGCSDLYCQIISVGVFTHQLLIQLPVGLQFVQSFIGISFQQFKAQSQHHTHIHIHTVIPVGRIHPGTV